MAEIELEEASVAARVPIVLVDELILVAIGIPKMLFASVSSRPSGGIGVERIEPTGESRRVPGQT